MRINPAGVDGADAAPRDRRDIETPIFAAGREQLDGVADTNLELVRQTISNNHARGVVAEIVKLSIDNLFGEIGRAQVRRRIDSEKIGRGCFESGARTDRAAEYGRAGDDVGKLPADPHDFTDIADPVEIIPVRRHVAFRFCGDE